MSLKTRLDIIDSAIATIEIELAYMKGALEGLRREIADKETEK